MALRWQSPLDDGVAAITNYLVYRRSEGTGCAGREVGRSGTATTFTDMGACMTGANHYRVMAVNLVGPGPSSAGVCGYTQPWGALVAPPGGRC